jgi:hypothetical protein
MRIKALRVLLRRVTEARTNREAFADVAHALKLLEGDPLIAEGRVQTLHDLQRRALAAESSHDPKVLQDLCAALQAFLNEELDEATRVRVTTRNAEDESESCEACGHSLEDAHQDTGGRVCRHCGHPMPAAESDDADDYLPYLPAPRDDSTEVHSMRRHHTARKHRIERKKKRRESVAVAVFNRSLRGDAPRPNRHLTPAAQFAELMGIPARARTTSPRPTSPAPAAVRFQRAMAGVTELDRVDRMAAAGKSPAQIFRALQASGR